MQRGVGRDIERSKLQLNMLWKILTKIQVKTVQYLIVSPASRPLVSNNQTICVRCLIMKVCMLMNAVSYTLYRDAILGFF